MYNHKRFPQAKLHEKVNLIKQGSSGMHEIQYRLLFKCADIFYVEK